MAFDGDVKGMDGFGEDDLFEEFKVFISQGPAGLRKEVGRFIADSLEIPTVSIDDRVHVGPTLTEMLDDQTDPCEYAIFILAANQGQDRAGDGAARLKSLYEIAFCQGKFGPDRVLVLKQEGAEEFTEIAGIE